MKILFCGGGTAGHIYPIIALTEVLKKNSRVKFIFIGSTSGQEKDICRNLKVPFIGIPVGKWRNYFSFLNVLDLLKTFLGLISAFFILLFNRPNVVFAKGGFVTFPILFWVKILKIPLVIHESDSEMGKANVWASRFAKKICTGFPVKYYNQKLANKIVFTGIPVRSDFFKQPEVKNERLNLLITGGSQGSRKLNEIVVQILPQITSRYNVYHLAGKNNLTKSEISSNHYFKVEYTENMAELMGKADLIISRAGATTLAEISALKKPAIIIPYKYAASDHQSKNAKIYEEQNAALVLGEDNLTAESLKSIIDRMMEDSELRRIMGHHASQFCQKDTAEQIINIIYEVSNVRK